MASLQRVTVKNLKKLVRCDRCRRRLRRDRGDWNFTLEQGVIVGFLCPTCQIPEENLEAEIRFATLDYGTDGLGRIVGQPKGGDQ